MAVQREKELWPTAGEKINREGWRFGLFCWPRGLVRWGLREAEEEKKKNGFGGGSLPTALGTRKMAPLPSVHSWG